MMRAFKLLSVPLLVGGAYYTGTRTSIKNQENASELFFNSRLPSVSADEQNVPYQGLPGTKYERTFMMVKPDGVQRQLTGEIIKRMETKGYVLVGLKMVTPDEKLVSQHYDDLKARPFYKGLVKYMSSSGPVVAMVFQGKGVVDYGRVMIGVTDPLKSAPGTIRGDLSVDVGRNTIHGSDGTSPAQDEIALWFKPEEVADIKNCASAWIYEK
ncbi:nucleoside-diphosphate kinase [Acrasis kona]|uniref:nucleoside-diphosphate kinase n=1 Tax=Acrasis kona TaxID=1008807 RepID=A0AAW2YWD7_9EUKA